MRITAQNGVIYGEIMPKNIPQIPNYGRANCGPEILSFCLDLLQSVTLLLLFFSNPQNDTLNRLDYPPTMAPGDVRTSV